VGRHYQNQAAGKPFPKKFKTFLKFPEFARLGVRPEFKHFKPFSSFSNFPAEHFGRYCRKHKGDHFEAFRAQSRRSAPVYRTIQPIRFIFTNENDDEMKPF